MVNIQYRSNLISVINEVEIINLTKRHHVYLQKTPFWNLIFSILNSEMNKDYSKKSDVDVQTIIKTFDPNSKSFKLGTHQIRIREEEIRTMFGIEDGDQFLDIEKSTRRQKTEFVSRRFHGLQRLKKQNISDALRQAAEEETKIGRQDVARLLTLFCLATLFVPTKGHSLSWSYIRFVENLDHMKEYNWSQHILDFLENSLCSTSIGTGVAGCIMMLPQITQYWICEHTTLVRQAQKTGMPRCIVWDLKTLSNALKITKLSKLKQDQVICHEEKESETNEESNKGSEGKEPETITQTAEVLSDDELIISDILHKLKSNQQSPEHDQSVTEPSSLGDPTGTAETASETVPADVGPEEPETTQSMPVQQQTDPVTSVLASLNHERIQELEQQLREKDERIALLEQQINEKDENMTKLFIENEALNLENLKLKAELDSVNATVDLLRADFQEANVQHTMAKPAPDPNEQPSMYKRLKGKTRQKKRDPQYTYSGKKKVAKKQKTATPAADTEYQESDVVDVDLLQLSKAESQMPKRHSTKEIIATFEKNTQLSNLEKKRIRELVDNHGQA